jgi:hypothetical protein
VPAIELHCSQPDLAGPSYELNSLVPAIELHCSQPDPVDRYVQVEQSEPLRRSRRLAAVKATENISQTFDAKGRQHQTTPPPLALHQVDARDSDYVAKPVPPSRPKLGAKPARGKAAKRKCGAARGRTVKITSPKVALETAPQAAGAPASKAAPEAAPEATAGSAPGAPPPEAAPGTATRAAPAPVLGTAPSATSADRFPLQVLSGNAINKQPLAAGCVYPMPARCSNRNI